MGVIIIEQSQVVYDLAEEIKKEAAQLYKEQNSDESKIVALREKIVYTLEQMINLIEEETKKNIDFEIHKVAGYDTEGIAVLEKLKNDANYNKLFITAYDLIVQLREFTIDNGRPLLLVRFETGDNYGDLTHIYELKESMLEKEIKITSKDGNQELAIFYKVNELKSIGEVGYSKAYRRYHDNFEDVVFDKRQIAKGHKGYNRGHIEEAFAQHFHIYNRGKTRNEDSYNRSTFTRKADRQMVHILIYYAKNSTDWYYGGDVDNQQIKAKNDKLGTINSLKEILNKLKQTNLKDKQAVADVFTYKRVIDESDPDNRLARDIDVFMDQFTEKTSDHLIDKAFEKIKERTPYLKLPAFSKI